MEKQDNKSKKQKVVALINGRIVRATLEATEETQIVAGRPFTRKKHKLKQEGQDRSLFAEDFNTHTSVRACITSILLNAYAELKEAFRSEPDQVREELNDVTELLNKIDPLALVDVETV